MRQAVLQRLREETLARPKMLYFGLLFDKEGKEVELMLQKKIYSSWDRDPHNPQSTRERERAPNPTLQILGWQNGQVFFPESLLQKFAQGTSAHKKVVEMNDKLLADFPAAATVQVNASGRATLVVPRAAGRPRVGSSLLTHCDVSRLEIIPATSFTEPRLLI